MVEMNFWDHVEALRKVLFRSLLVVALLAGLFFCFMTDIFDQIILAPCFSDFILYRFICNLSHYISVLPDFCNSEFHVNLINIQLASQFFIHMSTSFWLGGHIRESAWHPQTKRNDTVPLLPPHKLP